MYSERVESVVGKVHSVRYCRNQSSVGTLIVPPEPSLAVPVFVREVLLFGASPGMSHGAPPAPHWPVLSTGLSVGLFGVSSGARTSNCVLLRRAHSIVGP